MQPVRSGVCVSVVFTLLALSYNTTDIYKGLMDHFFSHRFKERPIIMSSVQNGPYRHGDVCF